MKRKIKYRNINNNAQKKVREESENGARDLHIFSNAVLEHGHSLFGGWNAHVNPRLNHSIRLSFAFVYLMRMRW